MGNIAPQQLAQPNKRTFRLNIVFFHKQLYRVVMNECGIGSGSAECDECFFSHRRIKVIPAIACIDSKCSLTHQRIRTVLNRRQQSTSNSVSNPIGSDIDTSIIVQETTKATDSS